MVLTVKQYKYLVYIICW